MLVYQRVHQKKGMLGMTKRTSEVKGFRALLTAIRICQQALKFALICQSQLQIRTCVLRNFAELRKSAAIQTSINLGGQNPSFPVDIPYQSCMIQRSSKLSPSLGQAFSSRKANHGLRIRKCSNFFGFGS